jgi:hypothetical protein
MLGLFLSAAPILYYDNIGAMYLYSNLAYHACTKHIKIDYYFVRDKVTTKKKKANFGQFKIVQKCKKTVWNQFQTVFYGRFKTV